MDKNTNLQSLIIALTTIIFIGVFIFYITSIISHFFMNIDSEILLSIITAGTAIIIATITNVVGRYLERKKEIESHFRDKKIEIYDEFVVEFFKLFNDEDSSESDENNQDLVKFLKDYQRKLILWGGSKTLSNYIKFMKHMKADTSDPKAEAMFLIENLFKSFRSDVGLSNRGLEKGYLAHLMLTNSDFFLDCYKNDPLITMSQISELEEIHKT